MRFPEHQPSLLNSVFILHIKKQYIVALEKEQKNRRGEGRRGDVGWERETHSQNKRVGYLFEREDWNIYVWGKKCPWDILCFNHPN